MSSGQTSIFSRIALLRSAAIGARSWSRMRVLWFAGIPFDPSNKTLADTTPHWACLFCWLPAMQPLNVDTFSLLPLQSTSTPGLVLLGLPAPLSLVRRVLPVLSSSFSTPDPLRSPPQDGPRDLIVLGAAICVLADRALATEASSLQVQRADHQQSCL